jgi:hypothetical protein
MRIIGEEYIFPFIFICLSERRYKMGKINMATATINSLLTLVQTAFNANRL